MRAIGTLAGGIAHEFNNLLQAISAQMDLLETNKNISAVDKENLGDVISMTGRAKELIKGILSFSHKASEERQHVDINEIVRDTIRTLEKTLPKNIRMQLDAAADPIVINANISQIQQILFNLATNSRDAMPDGGDLTFSTEAVDLDYAQTAQISSVLPPGKVALLRIADAGSGMESAVASEIFNPFYTTKDIGEGTGLGLSIVYGIVSSHNGHIECASNPGKGTTFTIYLPLSEAETRPQQREAHQRTVPEPIDRGKVNGVTVLVVDDEAPIRRLCKTNLEKAGFTVFTADSGEEAIKAYEKNRNDISIVVLDMGMPGMGGKKCIDGLKEIDPDVRIVIASGYLHEDYAKTPEKIGAVKFIGKPYRGAELAGELNTLLEQGA